MKVLIISRSFAPDNCIAAKRISMIAKHLSKLGHDITIIRSGIIYGKAEMHNMLGLEKVKIYSYEGVNCAAERFERYGEVQSLSICKEGKSNFVISKLRKFFRKIYHVLLDPLIYSKEDGKKIKGKIIDLYRNNPNIRGFDVVISSFSPLGSIQAAKYIRQQEHAAWIIDFRDLMNNQIYTPINRLINARRQAYYVKKADACLCVSEGNTARLTLYNREHTGKIYTVFNGYENDDKDLVANCANEGIILHICYTGTLYDGKRDCSPLFRVIKGLNCSTSIIIDYAGHDGNILVEQAKKFGLEKIIVDHGYLSRTEVEEVQRQSDIFLVLSWNTKHDQGILTGKFYEALQHRKPIVALVGGDLPNSELKSLIDHYHLGVCYESSTKNHSDKVLSDYIEQQVNRKKHGEPIAYTPDELVFDKFEYSKIAKQLECILSRFVNENGYEDT